MSKTSVRHSSTQDHGFVDVRCMGIIDRIIRKAVKIGEIPVDENEQGHTHKIEVYYCPVNIDGSQYSARLVVKQYENRGCVLEDFQLYDLHARQEKTGASYAVRGDKALTPTSAPVFSYKVKDLIHSTQENDIKILGLDENKLKFSVREGRDDKKTLMGCERLNIRVVINLTREIWIIQKNEVYLHLKKAPFFHSRYGQEKERTMAAAPVAPEVHRGARQESEGHHETGGLPSRLRPRQSGVRRRGLLLCRALGW